MLAVDLTCSATLGAVTLEQGNEEGLGDRFYVTWTGGEASTTLEELTIELGKADGGRYGYFDTTAAEPNGGNYIGYFPFTVVSGESTLGLDDFTYYFDGDTSNTVGNGASTLTIVFKNTDGESTFTADQKLVFEIDVDCGYVNSDDGETSRFEGADVQDAGVNMTAFFASEHFEMKTAKIGTQFYYQDVYALEYVDLVMDRATVPDTDAGYKTAGFETTIELDPKPIEISGYVYADVIKNCRFDSTDDYGIGSVEVTLEKKNDEGVYEFFQVTYTSTSEDSLGYYEFSTGVLPGEYRIISDGEIQYLSTDYVYTDSCARDGDTDLRTDDPLLIDKGELPGGTVSENNNFGKVLKGSVEGNVFEDRNNNGVFDHGEEDGIAGVTVGLFYRKLDGTYAAVLDANGTARTTKTDEDGHYYFGDLDVYDKETGTLYMTYAVRELEEPAGYTDGKNDPNGVPPGVNDTDEYGNDFISTINIGWNTHGGDYDFGELKLGSIEGNIFEDWNDNGVFDDNEPAITAQSVKIGLYWYNAETDQYEEYLVDGEHYVVQTENGHYSFENLAVFDETADRNYILYAVKEEAEPTGYSDGKDHVGEVDGVENVGKAGKDADGKDLLSEIKIGWDGHGENYDFGELKLGSVAGYVFEDHNDDGNYDMEGADKPIAGVKIGLYYKIEGTSDYAQVLDADNNPVTAYTDANGYYEFTDLDINRTYAVRELVEPDGYSDGKNHIGTLGGTNYQDKYGNDELNDIYVAWDDHGERYDFGELKPGSLSGYVFEDRNDDGIYDMETAGGADKPIAGVSLGLYYLVSGTTYAQALDADNNPITAVTDANGYYEFTGLDINRTYAVRELTEPDGYSDGKNHIGTLGGTNYQDKYGNDELNDIYVAWDEHGERYDFGELKPASISGHVYYDANDNGVFDEGDTGLVGETVTLSVWNGTSYTTLGSATTVENGYYEFTGLDINQTYALVETQPSGYVDSSDQVGTINGVTVGQAPENDRMTDIVVGWDNHGVDYDFGEVLPPEPDPIPDPPEGYNYGRDIPTVLPQHTSGGPVSPFSYVPENVATVPVTINRYGGGGGVSAYSWHLSVLNGGYPRSIEALGSLAGYRGLYSGRDEYMQVAWSNTEMSSGEWLIRGANGEVAGRYAFGTANAIPVVGDWNGDGHDSVGVYVDGQWYLDRNGDGTWDEDDLWAELGKPSDQPVAGDWDGDGKDDIGIFGPQWAGDKLAVAVEPGLPSDLNPNTFLNVSRPKNIPPEYNEANVAVRVMKHRNAGEVRIDLIDHVFEYGQEGDKAVTGDWNGDGVDKIGVFRDGVWYVDVNGNGAWDDGDVMIEGFGNAASIPVIGDWNGDGIDEVGLFEDGLWSLDTNGDYKPDSNFRFGEAGDRPVTGDFNGDGTVEFGVYREGSSETKNDAITL